MDPVVGVSVVAGVVAVAACLLAVVAVGARRTARAELSASREALAELRDEVALLRGAVRATTRPEEPDWVITSLAAADVRPTGQELAPVPEPVAVDPREFATVALRESVIRTVSLAHGVRRALSPANRNRIRFEMRREVKRARRDRRRQLKEAKRHLRTHLGDAA